MTDTQIKALAVWIRAESKYAALYGKISQRGFERIERRRAEAMNAFRDAMKGAE